MNGSSSTGKAVIALVLLVVVAALAYGPAPCSSAAEAKARSRWSIRRVTETGPFRDRTFSLPLVHLISKPGNGTKVEVRVPLGGRP